MKSLANAPARLRLLASVVVLLTLALSCRDPTMALTGLYDARRLAADLRIQFSKSTDASSRAVLADTDETSIANASESEQATQALERDAEKLATLLHGLRFSDEVQLLREFNARFSEYRKLDRNILSLAVENTNLKAQALSFGPASQAASNLETSLRSAATEFPAHERCRADGLVAQALLSVRKIQVLHGPHIAEHDDAAMTRTESEMAALEATARAALNSLGADAPAKARPALTDALSALDKFHDSSAQIVQLSRRNTNVVSLDLALRKRPTLVSACDDSLRALQASLAKDRPQAAR